MTKAEKELHNDIKRVAVAMEKLVKLLTNKRQCIKNIKW